MTQNFGNDSDHSRRGFVGALLAGTAGLAAGAAAGWFGRESRIPLPLPPVKCPPLPAVFEGLSPANDLKILNEALGLEHQAIYAYGAGAPLLSAGTLAVAKVFMGQHMQHRDKLIDAIEGGKGAAVKALEKYDLGLPDKPVELDVLKLALRLEEEAYGAYLVRIPKIYERALINGATSILADEASHAVLLRQAMKLPPADTFMKFPA